MLAIPEMNLQWTFWGSTRATHFEGFRAIPVGRSLLMALSLWGTRWRHGQVANTLGVLPRLHMVLALRAVSTVHPQKGFPHPSQLAKEVVVSRFWAILIN